MSDVPKQPLRITNAARQAATRQDARLNRVYKVTLARLTCSLSHPRITTGDQRGLQLDAAGSQVPGVQESAYAIYAAECHPEARGMGMITLSNDPDDAVA